MRNHQIDAGSSHKALIMSRLPGVGRQGLRMFDAETRSL